MIPSLGHFLHFSSCEGHFGIQFLASSREPLSFGYCQSSLICRKKRSYWICLCFTRLEPKWLRPWWLIIKMRKSCAFTMRYYMRPKFSISGILILKTRRARLNTQCTTRAGKARMWLWPCVLFLPFLPFYVVEILFWIPFMGVSKYWACTWIPLHPHTIQTSIRYFVVVGMAIIG